MAAFELITGVPGGGNCASHPLYINVFDKKRMLPWRHGYANGNNYHLHSLARALIWLLIGEARH
ncbi:hypothetical protein [Brenneria tiliae]|uniref:hypothetical protein n=1 Tax=Brenneria tiliae TaxID=2914984 RepID=UPI002014F329|nr:hypothetical protein [Brenneria tiliae]MCL2897946.1 hypothetical protein [Brenneria tiliae]MCL2902027.1 hypothetical protein [Brenneria tiliae]